MYHIMKEISSEEAGACLAAAELKAGLTKAKLDDPGLPIQTKLLF